MFQFRRFPAYAYLIQRTLTEYCSAGFPHSEISGSTAICASPKLIAACHVLHRLLMPRHSPCALISLTYFLVNKKVGKENFIRLPMPGLRIPFTLRSVCSQELEKLFWFSSSNRIMQASEFSEIVCFTLKVPQSTFVSLCCLLFILLVSLFSFQGAALT